MTVSAPEPIIPPAARHRPRVWTVFVAYVLVFGVAMVVSLIAVAVVYGVETVLSGATVSPEPFGPETLGRPSSVIASLAATTMTLGLSAVLLGLLSPMAFAQRLRLGGSGPQPWLWIIATLGALAIGQAFESAAALLSVPESESLMAIAKTAHEISIPAFLLLLFFGALLAGVAEELFFRGYMQTRLVARFGRWPGIVLTSAAFAILHMDPLHASAALLLGLYLGWLAERAGHVRLPMAVHVLNNACSLALSRTFGVESNSTAVDAILLATALVIGAAAILSLRWMRPRIDPLPVTEGSASAVPTL
ncbi:MAG TPA: type II CAAX endopeptidase family protein [Myxococcaceae bacterium]|nr:type II CAAX endopeptidase family protein [Myxococcaceae bacterium]